MHIFIDESGSFTGYHPHSISVVGALAIPNGKLEFIAKKYAKIRTHLPLEKGKVKGRLLNEIQVNEVVTMLARNDVLFEVTAADLAFHTEANVVKYKKEHAEGMLAPVGLFRDPDRQRVEDACHQISRTSLPLYLQSLVTFELIHVPLYFVQRVPHELATFTWIVDGKEPAKVTNWEMWWSWYACGAVATMSKRRPGTILEGPDYSYYDKFRRKEGDAEGVDAFLLLEDIRFCSAPEPGLELVDIVVNATRRVLLGSLGEAGWRGIPRLMIHRTEPYIQFVIIGGRQTPSLTLLMYGL